jgi:tRNA (guanine-N(7)-)-methyltransferase subunit TRM82
VNLTSRRLSLCHLVADQGLFSSSFHTTPTKSSQGTVLVEPTNTNGEQADGDERPAKKQKTTAKAPPALTNIIKLTVSNDQQHAVAVTEDKCVRVFSIQTDGGVVELSQRTMPKRPCALEILPDNDTIICGDKFGDVYSLPLLPTDESEKEASDAKAAQAAQDAKDAKLRAEARSSGVAFKPSATNLTVHTKRNLRSLEAQQKQKLFTPRKEVLAFEHKLLLGHVSMLTDATFATREVEGKTRGYIITADRDEHIRISRAAPQSHIIEGFCLGHTEFVSKLCLVPGTDLLISGGGDDWIGIWDWPSYSLKTSINIKEHLSKYLIATPEDKDPQVAVSGIWAVPVSNRPGSSAVVIACEKVPALLLLTPSSADNSTMKVTIVKQQLQGLYPLDVTFVGQHMLVSVDARSADQKRLVALQLSSNDDGSIEASRDEAHENTLKQLNDLSGIEEDPKSLDNLLYNVKNLKKRTGWGEQAEE